MNSVIEYIKENSLGSYSVDVDMSRHTTYKIGGTCGLFVEPNSIESVSSLIQFLSKKQVKYFIIGNGSNIILPDGYYNIVVIKLTKICNYKVEDSYVYVEAGILAPKLALELAYKGISGFEFISGVPGTIGGCVYMNAGAYGKETKDVLISVIAYDCNSNKLVELDNAELEFRYRHSIFQKGNFIILAAKFKYELQNSEEIVKLINNRRHRRVESQPIGEATAGSVFKNFDDISVWKVIEECGLRGASVGDAKVSEKHCNMIVNNGNATSSDVKKLIEKIIVTVREKTKREMVLEQRIIKWDD